MKKIFIVAFISFLTIAGLILSTDIGKTQDTYSWLQQLKMRLLKSELDDSLSTDYGIEEIGTGWTVNPLTLNAGAGVSSVVSSVSDDNQNVLTFDIEGTDAGGAYIEFINDNNSAQMAVGRTSGTESSYLTITDGGADNLPGFLSLYDDGGNGDWMWVSSDHVLRGATSKPADDDAGGYGIIDLDDGTWEGTALTTAELSVGVQSSLTAADNALPKAAHPDSATAFWARTMVDSLKITDAGINGGDIVNPFRAPSLDMYINDIHAGAAFDVYNGDNDLVYLSSTYSSIFSFREGTSVKATFRANYETDEFKLILDPAVGNQLVIGDTPNEDYDHAAQANPTLFIHSTRDPDINNTQWISATHDTTNGVITTGKGLLSFVPATKVFRAPLNASLPDTTGYIGGEWWLSAIGDTTYYYTSAHTIRSQP